jgi:hypothetical protein
MQQAWEEFDNAWKDFWKQVIDTLADAIYIMLGWLVKLLNRFRRTR